LARLQTELDTLDTSLEGKNTQLVTDITSLETLQSNLNIQNSQRNTSYNSLKETSKILISAEKTLTQKNQALENEIN